MQRFNVRSNCIAPFAWSRMTSSIPANTPEEQDRVRKLQRMDANKIAPLVVYLGSDQARHVTAQIFSVRANEIMLFSQPRPVRSVHMSEGWTPESVADIAMHALSSEFYALERSPDVINWDPISRPESNCKKSPLKSRALFYFVQFSSSKYMLFRGYVVVIALEAVCCISTNHLSLT